MKDIPADDLTLVPTLLHSLRATKPEEAYLIVYVTDDGQVWLQGSRPEVEDFLAECAHLGLVIHLDYLSWCG